MIHGTPLCFCAKYGSAFCGRVYGTPLQGEGGRFSCYDFMGITQKDIARRLGLSQSTVAKVLINSPKVWVSDDNRNRILEVAREFNYRPNRSAVALRFGKFNAVTLIYTKHLERNVRSANSTAVEVLASRLGEIGCELKVQVYPDNALVLERLTNLKSSRDTDAVVLVGREEIVAEQAMILDGTDIPFFVKGRFETDHPEWPQVDFDHEYMMMRAVEYLRSLGRTRLAYLGQGNEGIYSMRLLDGYRSAVRQFECFTSDELITLEPRQMDYVERAVERWLDLPEDEQPDGMVICGGIVFWHGVERVLIKRGRRVGLGPGEMAVAGNAVGEFSLLFGHAMGFPDLLHDSLVDTMYERQLAPALAGRPIDGPIIRVRPELQRLPSMELKAM